MKTLLLAAVCSSLLCTGCIVPPREGPPPNDEPWQMRAMPNGTLQSGFKTFALDTTSLEQGSRTSYGGGFGDFSSGETHFVGRTNSRYRFSTERRTGAQSYWLTYEVRELNRCQEQLTVKGELARIEATGTLGNIEVFEHPTFGEVLQYDRLIADFKTYSTSAGGVRMEAGAIFTFQDRLYNLLVFRVVRQEVEDTGANGRKQVFQTLGAARKAMLNAIRISRGQGTMCEVIANDSYFSRNQADVMNAVACAVNPYQTSRPAFCAPSR